MRKNTLNYLIDAGTLLVMVAMIGSGLIMKFTLPPGTGSRGYIIWGLGRHEWGTVHFWLAVALGVLLVLHVALHWSWICATTRRVVRRGAGGPGRGPRDDLYGVAFLLALVVVFGGLLWVADASIVVSEAAAVERAEEEAAVLEEAGVERPRQGLQDGTGRGLREGAGEDRRDGTGEGLGDGTGQGLGDGAGAGLRDGTGQGLRDGTGQDLRDGTGQGLRDGAGAGLRDSTGQGLRDGAGAGLRDGTGPGRLDGSGRGLGRGLRDGTGRGLLARPGRGQVDPPRRGLLQRTVPAVPDTAP